jgi:hypothetical protein
VQENTNALELGYTGVINNRATVSAAIYYTKNTDEIFFTQTGRYRAGNPPPGWRGAGAAAAAGQQALGVLEVLPPATARCCRPARRARPAGCRRSSATATSAGHQQGLRTGHRRRGQRGAERVRQLLVPGAARPELRHRRGEPAAAEPRQPRLQLLEGPLPGNMSYTWVDNAFWQDVLDARFHGPTDAYSQVNGAFGVKWGGEKLITTIKAINLLNEDVQSHVFGDILKRQVIGEVRVVF